VDPLRPPSDTAAVDPLARTNADIANDFGVRLALQTRNRDTANAAKPAALVAGQCDMALLDLISGVPDTTSLTTWEYGRLTQSLVVPFGNPRLIGKPVDLCGLKVGVISGSEEEAAAMGTGSFAGKGVFSTCGAAGKSAPAIKPYPTEETAVVGMIAGETDAQFVDSSVAADENYFYKAGQVAVVANATDSAVAYVVAVANGKPVVRAAVQKAFDAMNADGSLTTTLGYGGLVNGPSPAPSKLP
jgi:ABC-type amino acid transport substrate-binding protein